MLGLTAVVATLLVYGVGVEPRLVLDERRYGVDLAGLPPDLEGMEIAVFSDIQVGMWLSNLGMVERVVERSTALDPDAVVIVGDFLYGHSPDAAAQVETVADLLEPLTSSDIPVIAVLGNHDYEARGSERLASRLVEAGVEVLHNESVALGRGSSALHLVGVGPLRPGLSRPVEAFADVPEGEPRMVAMHHPLSFPELERGTAPLAVAGHTHCGQIAVPGLPHWSYLALRYEQSIAVDGWAASSFGAEGNRLFVTCGIGFSEYPVRISAPPQLVVFELGAA